MRIDLTKMQVAAVAAMLRDEMDEDERLYLDTLEGETDLYELARHLLNAIEADEGNLAAIKEQIENRRWRVKRFEDRIAAQRDGLLALLECAKLDKLVLPEATLSVRKVPPKPIIISEPLIPDELCKIVRKPDMAAIKAEVEAGRAVSGVSFDNGSTSLTVRRK